MRDEGGLTFEMRSWSHAAKDLLRASAAGEDDCGAVELGEMPAKRRDDALHIGSGRVEAGQLAQGFFAGAAAHRIDEILHGDLGAVAHDGVNVFGENLAAVGGK